MSILGTGLGAGLNAATGHGTRYRPPACPAVATQPPVRRVDRANSHVPPANGKATPSVPGDGAEGVTGDQGSHSRNSRYPNWMGR